MSVGLMASAVHIAAGAAAPVLETYQVALNTGTVSKPTGVVAGNKLVIITVQWGLATTIPTHGSITGFTYRGQAGLVGPNPNTAVSVHDRVADGTEAASFSVTGNSQNYIHTACLRLSGAGTFAGTASATTVGNSATTATVPAVTTTENNSLAISAYGAYSSSVQPTTPAGWSTIATYDNAQRVWTQVVATASTIGPTNFSLAGTEQAWGCYAFAYDPAP